VDILGFGENDQTGSVAVNTVDSPKLAAKKISREPVQAGGLRVPPVRQHGQTRRLVERGNSGILI
jgi:hypothetical protein